MEEVIQNIKIILTKLSAEFSTIECLAKDKWTEFGICLDQELLKQNWTSIEVKYLAQESKHNPLLDKLSRKVVVDFTHRQYREDTLRRYLYPDDNDLLWYPLLKSDSTQSYIQVIGIKSPSFQINNSKRQFIDMILNIN